MSASRIAELEAALTNIMQYTHEMATKGFARAALSAPAAPEGESGGIEDFKHWLNSKRDADVSSVFHEIVARFTALATPPAPTYALKVAVEARQFALGDRVRKTKGSSWQGRVVGFYSTELTPIGYAVESEREPGSVQIYPESALAAIRAKEEGL